MRTLFNLLPHLCPGCDLPATGRELCISCRSFLPVIEHPCPGCGRPLDDKHLCGACLKRAPAWESMQVSWQFTGLTRFLIHQFKYHRDLAAGRALIEQWSQPRSQLTRPDAVVAVPMHYRKQHRKGFNQAEWLAQQICRQWQLPLWQGVRRTVATPPLEGLKRSERQKVLRGVFGVDQTPPANIAIVDDVYTSGATLSELTKTLKKAGAQQVSLWVLARTPLGRY